jgi:hypothetical protein
VFGAIKICASRFDLAQESESALADSGLAQQVAQRCTLLVSIATKEGIACDA